MHSVSGIKPQVNVVLSTWRERLSSPTKQDWLDMKVLSEDWSTCAAGEGFDRTHASLDGGLKKGSLGHTVVSRAWRGGFGLDPLGQDFCAAVLHEDRDSALAILEQIEAKLNASIGQQP